MAYNDVSKLKMTNIDPVVEPICTKMMYLSWSWNSENDDLFRGPSLYRKIYQYPILRLDQILLGGGGYYYA